jgi:phosphoglycolate phosphatase
MTDSLPAVSLLITDLDNTLWDWVEIWRSSFAALLEETMRISGLSLEVLEAEIRAVHQLHGTAEYAFVLEELPSLKALHPGANLRKVYATALDARRAARNEACVLYPGVRRALEQIRASGVAIIGYTESMSFYTSDRLRRTGLDDVIDIVYSSPDHDLPSGMTREQIRRHPAGHYQHRLTVHRHTSPGSAKPNAAVLRSIVEDMAGEIRTTVYVGDSLLKDVAMAQEAGVTDVWARYGESRVKDGYEQLRRVTHWTPADVEREKAITGREISPRYSVDSFEELLQFFQFGGRVNRGMLPALPNPMGRQT